MSERTRVIPGEEAATGIESPWRLPSMDVDPGPAAEEEEAPAPQMPSVEEIERIQAEARAEAAEQGRREGYDAGFAEGREAGLAQGAAEVQERGRRLKGLIDSIAAPAAELDDAVEEELASMALAVARQVIRRELVSQPGEIIAVVREAVALLPLTSREIRLRVHPDDAALLHEQGIEGDWRLEEDPAVSRGGCLVDTDTSHVDASLEHRIARVAADLLGDQRAGDDDANAVDDTDGGAAEAPS